MRKIRVWLLVAIFSVALAGCKSGAVVNNNGPAVATPIKLEVLDLGDVNVQFSKTFRELSEEAKLVNDFLNPSYPVEPIPPTSSDRAMRLFIVRFDHHSSYPGVIEELKAAGYEPAPLHALVSVAIALPDMPKARDIVWLDNLPTDSLGGIWAGWLGYDRDGDRRRLYARGVSFGWSKTAWFLVTRK